MEILQGPERSEEKACPYLPGKMERHEFFYARRLNGHEMDEQLAQSFRKFGPYFFRPQCLGCQECRAMRILVSQFQPKKSQRRILKKNHDVTFQLVPLEFRRDVFDLYNHFLHWRFGREPESEEQFRFALTTPVAAAGMGLYWLGEQLIAVGFLDFGVKALSSVYFAYAQPYADRSLGTLGILMELNIAKSLGLEFYYLGYWVKECHFMNYKIQFSPYELYDATSRSWALPAVDPAK